MGTTGVISIQGDFSKHLEVLSRIGAQAKEIREPRDLAGVDRVILPGGESTTVGMLMQRWGLAEALVERVRSGIPIWGTCMGMILMATEIEDREQFSLGFLDITVRRNAFGPQIYSFEDALDFEPIRRQVVGVFIRAPIVVRHGPNVEVLSTYQGKVVAVRQGNCVGTSFHPELTADDSIHRWFLELG
jgi:5'-phosphate synthase pdxT subunit